MYKIYKIQNGPQKLLLLIVISLIIIFDYNNWPVYLTGCIVGWFMGLTWE